MTYSLFFLLFSMQPLLGLTASWLATGCSETSERQMPQPEWPRSDNQMLGISARPAFLVSHYWGGDATVTPLAATSRTINTSKQQFFFSDALFDWRVVMGNLCTTFDWGSWREELGPRAEGCKHRSSDENKLDKATLIYVARSFIVNYSFPALVIQAKTVESLGLWTRVRCLISPGLSPERVYTYPLILEHSPLANL